MKNESTILAEVKGLNYYDLLARFELVGEAGIENDKHYFFQYDSETIIEYHDKGDTTITTLSVDELIEYYS